MVGELSLLHLAYLVKDGRLFFLDTLALRICFLSIFADTKQTLISNTDPRRHLDASTGMVFFTSSYGPGLTLPSKTTQIPTANHHSALSTPTND